jgi:hypothetical protein
MVELLTSTKKVMRWRVKFQTLAAQKNERCRAADQCRPWPLVQKILTLPTDKYLGTKTLNIQNRYPVSRSFDISFVFLTMKRAPQKSSSLFFCIRQKFSLSDVAAKLLQQTTHRRVAPDSRPHDLVQSRPQSLHLQFQPKPFESIHHVHQHWHQRLRPHRPVSSTTHIHISLASCNCYNCDGAIEHVQLRDTMLDSRIIANAVSRPWHTINGEL